MQKYGVIGYPLTHSLSPQIHNYAFQLLKIDAVYEKIEVHPDSLAKTVNQLKNSGYKGLNITIPHKLNIMSFLDQIDSDAETIGAVNTIVGKENKWIGYNTDINGFLTPLLDFKDRISHCLIVGTGGAARAVIFSLAKYAGVQSINIAGRSPEKAASLKSDFSSLFDTINFDYLSLTGLESKLSNYNLIINTTPVGTFPNVDQIPLPNIRNLSEKTIVYDLVYNPLKTRLLQECEKAGKNIHLINGMEMLLQQAAGAFKLWTNQQMPVNKVRDHILLNIT